MRISCRADGAYLSDPVVLINVNSAAPVLLDRDFFGVFFSYCLLSNTITNAFEASDGPADAIPLRLELVDSPGSIVIFALPLGTNAGSVITEVQ